MPVGLSKQEAQAVAASTQTWVMAPLVAGEASAERTSLSASTSCSQTFISAPPDASVKVRCWQLSCSGVAFLLWVDLGPSHGHDEHRQ